MKEVAPTSPCINVCVLDAQRVCEGCGRTVDEITRWGSMSAAEQWQVIARLETARHQVTMANGRTGASATG